jgi:hypothetical protein
VLIKIAGCELLYLLRRDVDREDVQAPVIVEMHKSLGRGWLIEITSDNDGVSACRFCLRARNGRDKRNSLAVGRPREALALPGQRRIGSSRLGQQRETGTIGVHRDESRLAVD